MKSALLTAILMAAGVVLGNAMANDWIRTERKRVISCYQKYETETQSKDYKITLCIEGLEK